MSDANLDTVGLPARPKARLSGWTRRLAARPGFQSWASRFFLTRGIARREGEALLPGVAWLDDPFEAAEGADAAGTDAGGAGAA